MIFNYPYFVCPRCGNMYLSHAGLCDECQGELGMGDDDLKKKPDEADAYDADTQPIVNTDALVAGQTVASYVDFTFENANPPDDGLKAAKALIANAPALAKVDEVRAQRILALYKQSFHVLEVDGRYVIHKSGTATEVTGATSDEAWNALIALRFRG